jgi:NAD(P)-dependent dehydrogenase (short-subunit alcohol dehydrogenase family)
MDLRDLPGLEKLCLQLCDTLPRLDGIVNNACQTVRRPPAYYEHLLQAEAEGARAYLTGAGEPEQGITKFGQSFLVAGVADAPGGTTDATEDETGPNPEGTRVSSGVPSECVPSTSDAWRDSTAPLSLKSTGWMAPSASQSQLNVLRSDAEANGASHFPAGALDVNEQQIDLRLKTSWTTKLGEVETPELLEVLAVNTAAPFVLNGKLKALMARTVLGGAPCGRETSTSSDTSASESQDLREKSAQETHPQYSNTPKPGRGRAFIVNVSAMEGKFYRYKTCNHPHTNMAKAALNMMTATSAGEYAEHGIYMNAVDTGWINDENPRHVAARIAHDQNFQTPIDEEDAAARCAAPILEGFRDTSTEPPFGKFFKDYKESEW